MGDLAPQIDASHVRLPVMETAPHAGIDNFGPQIVRIVEMTCPDPSNGAGNIYVDVLRAEERRKHLCF